jgi:hypothetical protein
MRVGTGEGDGGGALMAVGMRVGRRGGDIAVALTGRLGCVFVWATEIWNS